MDTIALSLPSGALTLNLTDTGRGTGYLLLHGGMGPGSMAPLAGALGREGRVLTPVHPGFDGTPRPGGFTRPEDLADAYLKLLETLDLEKVVVVGNSFGGWVAAEMALRNSSRIAGMALLNPVAIDTGSPDRKIVDPTQVPPADRPRLSFHNPALATPPGPDQLARMAANQEALRVYAGPGLHDPHLRLRLAGIRIPTVIVWGLSDRIVDEDYGRLWAASIPGARFEPLAEAGHFPQIEQTQRVATLVRELSPGGGPR